MITDQIKSVLRTFTGHPFIEITPSGDAAINAALSSITPGKIVLIPEEGGWLSYKEAPQKWKLHPLEVSCTESKLNLPDLQLKLQSQPCGALLYQNPGGYFAPQPMKEIYELCTKNHCLVILDVSGSIGTPLCDGRYADIMVGSFGKWKLVEAHGGGFVSYSKPPQLEKMHYTSLADEPQLKVILQKLYELPHRISFLQHLRVKVLADLHGYRILHSKDTGFVVVIQYRDEDERKEIIDYCASNHYPYTQCPRYIRINQKAVSIELKRLEE